MSDFVPIGRPWLAYLLEQANTSADEKNLIRTALAYLNRAEEAEKRAEKWKALALRAMDSWSNGDDDGHNADMDTINGAYGEELLVSDSPATPNPENKE